MTLSYLIGVLYRAPGIILATIVYGSISLMCAPFDNGGRKQLTVARAWARMLLRIAGARVTSVGAENVDPDVAYVICPNHVSYMDTPVLLSHVPANFRFLARKELFMIPFLGGHLKRAGNISVPLEDPRGSLKVLSHAGHAMKQNGLSLLIFPEGGRSVTGELEPFKDGAAYLAIKGEVPILPVTIIGIKDVLPMHSHHLRPGRVTIRIGKPIETTGMRSHDRTALTQRLCDEISAMQRLGHA
ncbi:MAG: 1-acyl-sn-glycerol-3-phosphate acyltransferase [Bryobacteraceae bacterium]|nr:1-acyl-sn-glycerol-3-phosphate acyltransferase [Bryobacteraceae bacterium]